MDRARARPPLRGLGGIAHGGILVHDPRRGDGLGAGRRGQLGRDGPDDASTSAARAGRAADPRAKAGSPARDAGSSTTAGAIVGRDDRRRRSRRRPGCTSRPRGRPQARAPGRRYGFRRRRMAGRGRDERRRPSDRCRDDRRSSATRPPGRSRSSPTPRARRRGARRRPGGLTSTIPTRSPTTPARRAAPARRSGVPRRASSGSRPGSGRCLRRPLAAPRGRRSAASASATRRRPADAAPVRRRPPLPRAGARGALVRLRPPRADPRGRAGADLAAPAPRRARGRRLDHGRLARPPVRARASSREPYRWAELEQLVYSPSRWERRLVGSTIATMTHVGPPARPRSRGRRPRASRSSRQLIGDAEPDVQKALVLGLSLARPSSTRRADDRGLRAETDAGRRDGRRPSRLGHPRHAGQARPGDGRGAPRPPRRHPQATRRAVRPPTAPQIGRPVRRAARPADPSRTATHLTHPDEE